MRFINHRGRLFRGAVAAAAVLLTLAAGSSASQARVVGSQTALKTPVVTRYSTGIFSWTAVRRADHYEVQFANDAKFNSTVLDISTHSTSATLTKTLPDGRYWWRVRAVRRNGSTSRWVRRSFRKTWRVAPQLLSPGNGRTIQFPTDPLLLTWTPVLGAVQYKVAIARDSKMTTLVSGAQATTTAASYTPPATLADGTYYWTVTPVDAEKHEGLRSEVRSFNWSWPTETPWRLEDLVGQDPLAAPYFFDPLLSWTPVRGAAEYELDVNFSQDFNSSSRVCCSNTTDATGYSPTKPLPNNTYYWRVRPINAEGKKGVWSPQDPPTAASFMQFFDTIPPLDKNALTITGLHVRDEFGDTGPKPAGWATPTPILVWNPVPGASAYQLDIFRLSNGVCDIQSVQAKDLKITTPLTAWTPFGDGPGPLPYPNTGTTLEAGGGLAAGYHYCVRIRAVGETSSAGQRVYGDYTYLNDAFTYDPSTASGSVALPSSGDYISPAGGVVTGQTPLYTWRPIAGANSYWVIVARDPSFTTLVDYGFTQIPAYAPRRTLADETTSYYWAVLPAANANGTGLPIDPETGRPVDPLGASAANFQKRSTPPTLLSPSPGAVLGANQPTFRWTRVDGARNYRLQVSTDPNFSTLLDNVVTGSLAYVSTTTYPAQSTLYWRVQANDELGTALTWSSTGTFRQILPTPQPLPLQPPGGDVIPTWRWTTVDGAIAYDVRVVLPSGSEKVFSRVPTPAMVPTALSGTGAFKWQVRAEFGGSAVGPYSALVSFQRTVTPPTGARLVRRAHAMLFSWKGRPGIKEYILQIATRRDFSGTVESDRTEGTVLASTLSSSAYAKGGRFFWRRAAVDANGNTSGFSATKSFRIRKPSRHR